MDEMKDVQEKIKKFNEERDWLDPAVIKDCLLNMTEEIGEFWNIIKWVDVKTQKELIEKYKDEVGNFIGDMNYLTMKIAAICGINSEEESLKVIKELEGRFPIDKVKKHKHGNTLAGGIDEKE